jgi:hypothetical protein
MRRLSSEMIYWHEKKNETKIIKFQVNIDEIKTKKKNNNTLKNKARRFFFFRKK